MIKPRSLPSHFELETQSKEWNNSQFIPSSASRNFQTMLPGPEQPALQTGNLVTPAVHEQGTSTEGQNIATSSSSSSGVTQPSISVRRSACSTKEILSIQDLNHFVVWSLVELSGRCFVLNSNQPGLIILFHSINCMVITAIDTHIVLCALEFIN